MAFKDGIGYNVKKANELMSDIVGAYKDLGNYAKDSWDSVVTSLQTNWVGEDEQHYEKELAKKINELYFKAGVLTQNAVKTIGGLAEAWMKFQSSNTIDGSTTTVSGTVEVPTLSLGHGDRINEIVFYKMVEFDDTTDRGLKSQTSATQIKTTIDTFVRDIKTKTKGLFDKITADNAFFGDQVSSIKAYVDEVGVAISEVAVAIQDIYTALDTLAKSSYTTATSDISTQFTTAKTEVETSINDLGASRWTGGSGGAGASGTGLQQ